MLGKLSHSVPIKKQTNEKKQQQQLNKCHSYPHLTDEEKKALKD